MTPNLLQLNVGDSAGRSFGIYGTTYYPYNIANLFEKSYLEFSANAIRLSTTTLIIDDHNWLDIVYPIDSTFMSKYNLDPASLFGGTWTLIDKGFKTKNIEKSYSSIEAFAKSLNGEKSIIINLEYQEKKKEKDIESKSIKDKYVKLREEVKNNRSLYDDPYVDNDKSLRLE
jgi:hypothetical protein